MISDMTTIQQHQDNLMQMINDCPDLLIQFFDTTIDTLQNIAYVFNKYQINTLVNALKKSQNPTVLRLENHLPIYVTDGLCDNIKSNIKNTTHTGKVFPLIAFESDFNRYLRFRLFDDKTYPVCVQIMDLPLKIREDIENNYILNNCLDHEILSTDVILPMQQYGWHRQFAQYNGYELAMYDPRSPYGKERLELAKTCISELIKIREFIQDYIHHSNHTIPLSETIVLAQQAEAQPWTKSTSRTHQV